MHRHRRDLEVISDMNLTNLMDTAFILLIAFMLVAPVLKHGIDLQLPQVSRQQLSSGGETMTIVIAKAPAAGMSEEIYVDDQRLTLDELKSEVRLRKESDGLDIVIEADAEARYDMVAKVIALLKNLGVDGVGLATEPESL